MGSTVVLGSSLLLIPLGKVDDGRQREQARPNADDATGNVRRGPARCIER